MCPKSSTTTSSTFVEILIIFCCCNHSNKLLIKPGPENKFATDPIKSREPLPASSLIPAVPSTPQCLSVSQTTSVVSGSMSGSSILVEALRDGRSLVSKANKKSH